MSHKPSHENANTEKETEIKEVASQFTATAEIETIKDISHKQGWSTKYLYEIKLTNNQKFILKGKTKNQQEGFSQAIKVTEYLLKKGFLVRKPLKKRNGKGYSLQHKLSGEEIYWSMTEYVSGIDSDIAAYTPQTAASLARKMTDYLRITEGKILLSRKLRIRKISRRDRFTFARNAESYKEILEKLILKDLSEFKLWLDKEKKPLKKFFSSRNRKAILHGDLNQKNILTDETQRIVTAIIDWDHCVYDYYQTDIATAINLFFEYAPPERAALLTNSFLENIDKKYVKNLRELRRIGEYQATKSKWESITFYSKLLQELGNTTGEADRFKENIRGEAKKWAEIMACWEGIKIQISQ